MSVRDVSATVDEMACSGTVTVERETPIDPGGTWVEDVKVEGPNGEQLDYEELDGRTQERIDAALVDAMRSDGDADSQG